MTGPEHYRAAEELLASADISIGQYEEHGWDGKHEVADNLTAQALAHATLALAASFAEVNPKLAWREVAGPDGAQ